MISGSVNANLEAVIWVKVYGPSGLAAGLEAVVDTGFDSYLTLPHHLIDSLGLPQEAPVEVTLADGRIDHMDFFNGTIWWDGQALDIPILRTDGDPMVGMALLRGYRLTVDVVDGGTVTIEPLPSTSGT